MKHTEASETLKQEQAFHAWFQSATGNAPYPFQVRFACEQTLPELVDVPTGLGKTAMAVLGWLWRRRFLPDEAIFKTTPRRLVYCLPMRVLVEQTAENARKWIDRLQVANFLEKDELSVHVLMGGENEEDWDIYPECDQIIVGTQDMLLSRALNRGYAATRSRWPIKFGLLNTDCLWVFDEIQLMGAGLATTAQLEAFRRLLPAKDSDEAKSGHCCLSVWMSATLQPDWLKTVDFKYHVDGLAQVKLKEDDHNTAEVEKRWTAQKPLAKTETAMGDVRELAQEIRKAHKPGTRTIVIVNTVKRARALFDALDKELNTSSDKSTLVLLHSRFRPGDRQAQVERALMEVRSGTLGTIVISTQVIEAGVDVTSTTLFTEVAPWSSLVQRFGRCNRRGEDNEQAKVYWVGLPGKDAEGKKVAAPYELEDLKAAEGQLKDRIDVGLQSLPLPHVWLSFEHSHVIRRKDLVDLFDTTPDLAGNDIDIDRFIRDVEDSDVHIFWRAYGENPNETEDKEAQPAPRREELCPARIGEFKTFATDKKRKGFVWRWNFLEKRWEQADQDKIVPGQVYLVHSDAGGYTAKRGWAPENKGPVDPIEPPQGTTSDAPDATDADPLSHIGVWQTIAQHTDDLCRTADHIAKALNLDEPTTNVLHHAARWHDRGKAHHVFQNAIDDGQFLEREKQKIRRRERPEGWRGCRLVAKAPNRKKDPGGKMGDQGFWRPYDWMPKVGRKYFRHELASALSVLDPRNTHIPDELRDLVAYLVAAHHGKVRLSIRSLPNEQLPGGNRRFARGVWDADELPETDLGNGVVAPKVSLSLEPMELGLCEQPPFSGLSSWAERVIRQRDSLGLFRLAYLEALLRAADWRASAKAEQRETEKKRDDVSDDGKGIP